MSALKSLQEIVNCASDHIDVGQHGWEERLTSIRYFLSPIDSYGRRYVMNKLLKTLREEAHNRAKTHQWTKKETIIIHNLLKSENEEQQTIKNFLFYNITLTCSLFCFGVYFIMKDFFQ